MTTVLESNARFSNEPGVFSLFKDEQVNLAVWERDGVMGAHRLLSKNASDVRFACDLDALQVRLLEALDASGYPPVLQRQELIDDIAILAQLFCNVMDTNELELRLEVVNTNSCRKFHGDYVKARLITTYVGEGTQWLEQEDVGRLEKGQDPCDVRQLREGDVGIFKGKLATQDPAIHRSPPIEGTGQARLLLVLNQV